MLHVPCKLPAFISTHLSDRMEGAEHSWCVPCQALGRQKGKRSAWRNTWQWAMDFTRRGISNTLSEMFSEGCIAGGLGDPKHEAFGRHVREIEVEADILRDLQYKIEEG